MVRHFRSRSLRSALLGGVRGAAFLDNGLLVGLLALITIGAVTASGERTLTFFERTNVALNFKGPNENASDTGKENAAKNKPKLIGVEAPADGAYKTGDVLTFTLFFDKTVRVPSEAYIEIDIGGVIRQAIFDGGPDGTSATFSYLISEQDVDEDGVGLTPGIGGGDVTDEDGLPLDETPGGGSSTDPDTGGVTIPGGPSCSENCLYVALGNGKVLKIGDDGGIVWTFAGHTGPVRKIAVDAAGFIYTAGADNTTRKISPDGEQVWSSIVFGDDVLDVAVTTDGAVYSAGWIGHINKLDGATGQLVDFINIEAGRDIPGLAVDAAGMVYASTRSNNGTDGRYLKLDSDLNVIWSRTNASQDLLDIGVDTSGRIYTVGHRYQLNYDDDNHVDDSGYVYEPDGATLARLYYPVDGQVSAIGVNPAGGAAVAMRHFNPTRYEIMSFSLANNDIRWRYSGHTNGINDLAYDRSGQLYTASSDMTVRVLNAQTGAVVATHTYEAAVYGVAISPGQFGAGF